MEIRIVRGRPTDVELAALTAVLVALPTPQPSPPGVPSNWRTSGLPAARRLGADAWRLSGLPR